MDRYFDAFVYVANWGTRRLMFRIPRPLPRRRDGLGLLRRGGGPLAEGGEGSHRARILVGGRGGRRVDRRRALDALPDLDPRRADARRPPGTLPGLARLGPDVSTRKTRTGPGSVLEPPVPPGLAKLSGPLKSLAEFLRIDDELIEVAARSSAGEPPAEASKAEMARWVKGLPVADKDAYLLASLPRNRTTSSGWRWPGGSARRPRSRTASPVVRQGAANPQATDRGARRPRARRREKRPPSRPRRRRPPATARRPRPGPNTSTTWRPANPRPGARSRR